MVNGNGRDPIVDAAKGYGILLVFLGHLVYYDSPLFRVIFNFHMPLFFLLSGMTFSTEKYGDCKDSLKMLWTTIGVPFVFFTFLGTAICILTNRFMQHSFMDWLRAGVSFLHGDPYVGGSLWFLTCLCVVKFLFVAWSKKRFSRFMKCFYLVCIYTCGIVFGRYVHPKILLIGPLMCFSVPMGFFFFALGHYSKDLLLKIHGGSLFCLFVLALLLFGIEVTLALPHATPNLAIPSFPSPCTFFLAASSGICSILFFSRKSFSCIRFIGRYSLYYFLMERWVREAWFALSSRVMPSFIPNPSCDNSNLLCLTGWQITVTLVVEVLIVTALLPILKIILTRMRDLLKVGSRSLH